MNECYGNCILLQIRRHRLQYQIKEENQLVLGHKCVACHCVIIFSCPCSQSSITCFSNWRAIAINAQFAFFTVTIHSPTNYLTDKNLTRYQKNHQNAKYSPLNCGICMLKGLKKAKAKTPY